jgi:autotransporter strand-loop-strand O-heptosyltransferase
MKITQVTPGLITIPPNGWGAVEKIIYNYQKEFQELNNRCDIKYLNEVELDSDIVHIHIANLAIEAANKGIPYIFSLHDHHVIYFGKESFRYEQNLEAIQKSVISFTHAEFLVDFYDVTDKLFYLSHGVEVDYFKTDIDRLYRKEQKLLCIASNGIGGDVSFDRKGFRFAIEAAKKLGLPITIAGPGSNKEFFEHHKDLLDYEKLTLLTHNLVEDDILELYRNHSIFIHPSILEAGHPNLTLLEAVSCGLPVVGTYEGSKKIDGMIVTERDSEQVAAAIFEIINKYEYYVDQTQLNRTKFDWTTICKRILNMYKVVNIIKKEYSSNDTKSLLIENIENTINTGNIVEKLSAPVVKSKLKYNANFVNSPFFEILGSGNRKYKVEFYDGNNVLNHSCEMTPNMWTKLSREYYTDWTIKVFDADTLIYIYKIDLSNHKVFITFESSSLGDTIAWLPYVLEFKIKHNCEVVLSTFWNNLFEDSYPEIKFVHPGSNVSNIMAMYKVGWFYDNAKEPVLPNTIPLQKSATNILGLEFNEIKTKIDFIPKERPVLEKYITIANESTAGLKLWNLTAWQELVNYLNINGYKVINVSKNGSDITNVTKLEDTSIENTMNYIHHSEFFIGLSSGLSWLAWAINKHVVMISNFTEEDHEFTTNCTRIVNHSVCNSCWNNTNVKFDKGDWNWCPEHKDTPRHFECHNSITSKMVIDKIQGLL